MSVPSIPDFDADGFLPVGIHACTLSEIGVRFGGQSAIRGRLFGVLRGAVNAACAYPSTKRILIWGSFVTSKPEPADLDYSVIVGVNHDRSALAEAHEPFLAPWRARQQHGVDAAFLIVADYPLEYYVERVDFMCRARAGRRRGIIEISLRGETSGARE